LYIRKADRVLAQHDQELYFIDGNHESFPTLWSDEHTDELLTSYCGFGRQSAELDDPN
jgi:hypothetical protein